MLKIRYCMGRPESKDSGMDTLEECLDKDHYLSHTKDISYRYNSRGFRDHEWPEDLSNVVWCVGDSFTVGTGQPFEESWPQVLEKKIGKRCINLGEDGCANDTLALRIQEICKLYKPKLIVVMWSYLHRRRIDGENVQFDKKDFGADRDLKNFIKNYELCAGEQTKIIHSIIPGIGLNSNYAIADNILSYILQKKNSIHNLIVFPQLDYARDHHHFDIKTSELVTDLMIEKINTIDNSSKYPV
jgi:hypothetical protein